MEDEQTSPTRYEYLLLSRHMFLAARHAQFNRKSDIFGLQIGSFQGRSFPDRWSRGTKTLGTRVYMARSSTAAKRSAHE